jgi:hypothetical protein
MHDQSPVNQPMERRFTVHEAASALGITPEAVRGRIQRGTLPKEKGKDGSVYVRLTVDQTQSIGDAMTDATQSTVDETADESPLVEELKERIDHLTRIIETRDEEIRRRDTILLSLTQRIPELEPAREAPPGTREGHEMAAEEDADTQAPPKQERRSWWRKLFSG